MSILETSHQALEDCRGRLASEALLARAGSDDGLIPSYSLVSDLATLTADDAGLHVPVVSMRTRLDALLDAARPFDEETLQALRLLVGWLGAAIEARERSRPMPVWTGTDETPPVTVVADGHRAAEARGCEEAFEERLLDLNLAENTELLVEFHAEAIDHLSQIESSLLTLDENPGDRDALNQLFRSFHTIKGVSGFLHLAPMHTLTHEVESLLDLARTGRLRITPVIVTAILESRDAVQAMLGQITAALEKGRLPDTVVPVGHLISAVKALALDPGEPRSASAAPAVPKAPTAAAAPAPGGTLVAAAEPVAGAGIPPRAVEARGSASAGTVRVNTEKLDSMMNVVGELVIVQSQIAESARAQAEPNSPLARNIAQFGRITKELQRHAMTLRLMPIRPTFQKMERLARDLARDFGKKVAFHTEGEDTEVDRTVVEEIADPLVHMVRNSLDHGLEPVAERVAAGKPEHGSLSLKAYNQGSHIIIELIDDGRGIDPARILAKAIEKGLVAPGDTPSRDEILGLIFAPGFSTAATVTAVSGRGVGMDVVKRNIDRLRGKVEILTEPGRGTTFRIRLPLTTAIIDGLVVRVGADRFILPGASVRMALRPEKSHVVTVHGRGEVLEHHGRIVPIRRLHRQFRIPGAVESPENGILVIVETRDRVTALLVDELVGKQEVVVKNLGAYLADLPGIAGGAILGDGDIALILDPASLIAA